MKSPAGRRGYRRRRVQLPSTRDEMRALVASLMAERERLRTEIRAHMIRFNADYPMGADGECTYCGSSLGGNPDCTGCAYDRDCQIEHSHRPPHIKTPEAAMFYLSNMNLPQDADYGGYIYVVEFSTGIIKVGSTAKPEQRLSKLESQSAAFGATIARWWVSPRHDGYKQSERFVLAAIGISGADATSREFFESIDFEDVLEIAGRIDFEEREA